MIEKKSDKNELNIWFSPNLFELLGKFSEIDLEDVETKIGDLKISLKPSMSTPFIESQNIINSKILSLEKIKPNRLLKADFNAQKDKYPGQIIEVKLGATKKEGGSRGSSITIGGEKSPPFHLFEGPMNNKPVISFDVFDKAPSLARAMRAPFQDVLDDPAAWAKRCVDKFNADVVQLHLISIDPLLTNTSPARAVKTVEDVLQAIDVPLTIGGCGDPKKDFQVFEKVAEVAEGERLLINSITLDMDIPKMAKLVRKYGHAVIAFTPMDMSLARELNRRLYEFLPKEDILNDTTTAALGYGLEYSFTIMERTRLSGLMGDPELQHPLCSGSTNAWAAREAWMKMESKWGPRELRGPMWETVTALTLLLAGVDFFMMMHPAAVKVVKRVINELARAQSGKKESSEKISDWIRLEI